MVYWLYSESMKRLVDPLVRAWNLVCEWVTSRSQPGVSTGSALMGSGQMFMVNEFGQGAYFGSAAASGCAPSRGLALEIMRLSWSRRTNTTYFDVSA